MRTGGKLIASLLAAGVILASALSLGAAPEVPSVVSYLETFSYLKAWGEFGIYLDELSQALPKVATEKAAATVKSQGQTAQGIWDGATISHDDKAMSWELPLTVSLRGSGEKIALKSRWADETLFPWGMANLIAEAKTSLPDISAFKVAISIIGAETFVTNEGRSAVLKSTGRDACGLYSYLVLTSPDRNIEFSATILKKGEVSSGIIVVELPLGDPQQGSLSKGAELTVIRAITDADALAFAQAWRESIERADSIRPDVRLTGVVDKAKVNPGETIRYTYYLFNAGMDQASGLVVSIPVPSGGSLIPGSVSGDGGIAKLMPSATNIDLEGKNASDDAGYAGANEIMWEPAGSLRPGETIKFSFEFIVK